LEDAKEEPERERGEDGFRHGRRCTCYGTPQNSPAGRIETESGYLDMRSHGHPVSRMSRATCQWEVRYQRARVPHPPPFPQSSTSSFCLAWSSMPSLRRPDFSFLFSFFFFNGPGEYPGSRSRRLN
jgi:hypothetical protein